MLLLFSIKFLCASWIQLRTDDAFANHGITPPNNTIENGIYYFWNYTTRELIAIRPTSIGGNNNLYLNYAYSILNSSGGENVLLGQSVTTEYGFNILSNPNGNLQIGSWGNNGRGGYQGYFIYISYNGSKYANRDAQGTWGYLPLSAGNIHQIETGRRHVGGSSRGSGWIELTYSWVRTTPVTTTTTPTSTPQTSTPITTLPPEIEAILNPPTTPVPSGFLRASKSTGRGGTGVTIEYGLR